MRGSLRAGRLWPYLFLAPFLLLFAVFLLYPVAATLVMSFQRKEGLAPGLFVGAANYAALASDARFGIATRNTLLLVGAAIFLIVPCSLALALALNDRGLRLRGLYRMLFFLPAASSAVVTAIVFLVMFEENYGFINGLLGSIGVGQVPWLTSSTLILPSIVIVLFWKSAGYKALYFLAGLQTINPELVDAARVDGASHLRVIRDIYLPLLRPITFVVVVLSVIGTVQLFAEPYLMTRGTGGPGQGGLTLAMLIYEVAFRQARFGYAAAIAYVSVIGVIAASLIAAAALRRKD